MDKTPKNVKPSEVSFFLFDIELSNNFDNRLKQRLKLATLFIVTFLILVGKSAFAQKILDNGELSSLPSAAYSLRQLKTDYTHSKISAPTAVQGFINSEKPLIRVRRSTDNQQLDIGYSNQGELDTATLKAFAGNGSAYVVIWFDQSGNSRDVSQTNTARQPRIINSGVVERSNQKPAIKFSRNNDINPTILSANVNAGSMFNNGIIGSALAVFEATSGNSSAWGYGNSSNRWQIHANEGENLMFDYGNSWQRTACVNSTNVSKLKQYAFIVANSGEGQIWINGVLTATGNAYTGVCTATLFEIGGISNFNGWNHDYHQSELILFNTALSNNDRSKAIQNQNSFYNNTISWTGKISDDYNTAGNWSTQIVPNSNSDVYIPSNMPHMPVLRTNAQVKSLTIEKGTQLDINDDYALTLTEDMVLGGTTLGNGKIIFGGNSTQTIGGNNGILGNIEINNLSNLSAPVNIHFSGLVTFTSGKLNIGNSSSNPVVYTTATFEKGIANANSSKSIISSNQNNIVIQGNQNSTWYFDQTTGNNYVYNFTVNTSNATQTLSNGMVVYSNVNIGNNSTLILDAGSTMNRNASGGSLVVNGTLVVKGTSGGLTGSNFPSNFSTNTLIGTVNYGALAIQSVANLIYTNLTISGSGTKTLLASEAISESLSINDGCVLGVGALTTHTAKRLYIDGVGQISGRWGSNLSSATYKSNSFSGTGYVTITSAIYNWIGNTSTNWSTASNWLSNSVPTSNSDVEILSTATRMPVISTNVSCKDLILENGTSLTINSGNTLTINGNFENQGGTLATTGIIDFNSNNTYAVGTATTFPNVIVSNGISFSLRLNGSCENLEFASGGGNTSLTHDENTQFSINGNVTFTQSTSNFITKSWNINGADVNVLGLISYTGINTNTTRVQQINVTNGTLSALSGISFSSVNNVSRKINLTNAKLNIGGNLTLSGTQNFTADASSVVNFTGSTAQTIGFFSSGAYNHLNISNTAGATLGAALTTSNTKGNLTVESKANLNNGGFAITGNNTAGFYVADSATFVLSGTTSAFPVGYKEVELGSLSTVEYSGSGAQTIAALEYGNLKSTSTGARTLANSGTIVVKGTFTPGNNTYTNTGSTINYSSANETQLVAAFTYNNLTLTNISQKYAAGDITVNGELYIAENPTTNAGHLEMTVAYGDYAKGAYSSAVGYIADTNQFKPSASVYNATSSYNNLNSYVLTMGANSTTKGPGDVTGKIRRTSFTANTPYSFGNHNTLITLNPNTTGTLPSQLTVISTRGTNGRHIDKGNTVKRLYQVLRTGGTNPTTMTLRFAYNETELDTNSEQQLVFWDHHLLYQGITPHEHGKTNQNTNDNWVELASHGILYLATENNPGFVKYWMLSNKVSVDTTWLGAVPGGNWNIASNWSSGTVPSATSKVIIPTSGTTPNDPTITNTVEIGSIEIKPGGVLNGGSGTLVLNAGPAINGGAGSWLNNGTFNAGTGTVVFNHTDGTIAGNTTFNNITINANKKLTIQPDAVISFTGTLLNNGTLDASTYPNEVKAIGSNVILQALNGANGGYYNLTLSGSGTAVTPSELFIKGNYITNQPVDYQTNNTTVILNGIEEQIIDGTIDNDLPHVIIRNAKGITLQKNAVINGNLTIEKGKLSIHKYKLTLKGDFIGNDTLAMEADGVESELAIEGTGPISPIYFSQKNPGISNRLKNLTYNRSNSSISLGNNLELIGYINPISGQLNANGKLTLISNQQATAFVKQGSGNYLTGNVKVQRYVPAVIRRSRMISAPVTGATYSQFIDDIFVSGMGGVNNGFDYTPSNGNTIYTYAENTIPSRGWKGATHITNSITPGEGLLVFVRGDRTLPAPNWYTTPYVQQNEVTIDFEGEINKGTINVPVSFTPTGYITNDGWNMVGNPYPSPVNWNTVSKFGIDELGYYVLNSQTGSYEFEIGENPIASGQAIFVHAILPNPTLSFNESDKVDNNSPLSYFKTSTQPLEIKVVKDNLNADWVKLKVNQTASKNYMVGEDGLKFTNSLLNLYFVADSTNYKMQYSVVPSTQTIDTFKLAFDASNGDYTLYFNNLSHIDASKQVYLLDNFTNALINLRTTTSYLFNVTGAAGSYGNRFKLIIGDANMLPVTYNSFEGKLQNKQAVLTWNVGSQKNNLGFVVEKSTNQHSWTEIGFVKGSGNTTTNSNFKFVDENPFTAENIAYYRLKQVDYNNKANYSKTIVLHNELGSSLSNVYPNPFTTSAYLNWYSNVSEVINITITNIHGEIISSFDESANVGETKIEINNQTKLKAGVYFVKVNAQHQQTFKLIKE